MLRLWRSGLIRKWIPLFLITGLLLAACVPPPDLGGTVPGGTVPGSANPSAPGRPQGPHFKLSPFCHDVLSNRSVAAQVLAAPRSVKRKDHIGLYSYLLFGPAEQVAAMAETVVGRARERNFILGINLIPLAEERVYYSPQNEPVETLPRLSGEGKEAHQTFAGQSLAVIGFADPNQPLTLETRQFLRDELYGEELRTNFPDVQSAPNMHLTGSTNHSGGGGPFGNAPHSSPASYNDYRSQYAFNAMKLPVPIAEEGQDTAVFVLDSWPDAVTTLPAGASATSYVIQPDELDLDGAPYSITVYARPLEHESPTGPMPGRVHGRYVASLAHTVAPQADIYAYRVLNDAGEAHLSDLITALADVEAQLQANPQPAVINLSLGLDCVEIAEERVQSRGPATNNALAQEQMKLQELHDRLLGILASQKAVISAAAGNNAFPGADHYAMDNCPLTSDGMPSGIAYPACLDNVISVGASTKTPSFACYSSGGPRARIFAFAGDGGPGTTACEAKHTACMNNQCAFGVLGLVQNTATFGFWSGTSFAAPLVSGAAAVLLGVGLTVEQVPPCLIAAADHTPPDLPALDIENALQMARDGACSSGSTD